MSGTYVDRWFADPQLDLSFHLEDASTSEWMPAGTESQKAPRLSVGKRGTFGQPVFVDVPMANPRRSSRVPNLNEKYQREERDSRGGYDRPPVPSKQPIGQFQTVEVTPDKRNSASAPRRSPNQRQSALLTIAEFETSPTRPLSTYSYSSQATSYTPQTKPPQQYKAPSSTVSSAVSSVSTQRSTTSSTTTLDYSLFSLPVNGLQYTGGGGGGGGQRRENPQPRPEQYIQQSARRPMNRGNNSPRQSSFNSSQRGQKVFRVNSRGASRRGSIRKQQYGPGKPKPVGDIRAIPTCTVGAQRIHVVRPSERPHIVGIPPPHRHPASRKSQYPVIQTTTPPEFPVPAIISITPPSATTPEPQELPVTASPKELCAGEFGFPPVLGSAQALKSTTPPPPPPAYTPPPPPPSCAPPPPPPPAYTAYRTKTPEPRGAPVSPPASPPRSQENLRQMLISTSKPLPSIPPLVTGWPSWGKEGKDETTEKKDVVKVVTPPSPAETSWDPAGWKDEEVPKKEEVKAVSKEEEKATKKEELKIIVKEEEKQKVAPTQEPKAEAEKEKMEPRKMPEIPEALRIGNKQNSSLFQRLSSLETMDIPSRY